MKKFRKLQICKFADIKNITDFRTFRKCGTFFDLRTQPEFPQAPIYTIAIILSLLVMRGECNTHSPPHPLFFCGKLCENIRPAPIGRQPLREMRGLSGSHIQVSRAYQCKILKFGFSFWIMSPSVGLTFQVSNTFCL
jgi:hypothetical protein